MRYFYDTEFIEDGRTIDLISIGAVAEDGREFYAVSTDFDASRANPWVRKHVLPQLPKPAGPAWRSRRQIREELAEFLGGGTGLSRAERRTPQLWAWIGAYDHVALAQLWGDMSQLPRIMPHYTRDIKQLWEMAGRPQLPNPPSDVHDALVDARFAQRKFRACIAALPLRADNTLADHRHGHRTG